MSDGRRATVLAQAGGIAYFELEDPAGALPLVQEAVELFPEDEVISVLLFHILGDLGRGDEAFAEARRFLQLNSMAPEYRELLSDMQAQLAEVE